MQAGAPDPMGADPNIGAGIGNMAEDPNAGAPTEDPNMDASEDVPGDDDSTATIIDQLSDEDKEAVRNYAKSLLNRDEAQPDEMAGQEEPTPASEDGQQGVMMEITKGRLKKVQGKLTEIFGNQDDSNSDRKDKSQKKVNPKKPGKEKGPFDSYLD